MSDEPMDHNGESTEDLGRRFGEVTEPDTSETSERRLQESQELPERIGHFKILEILGEGGMGIVYLAEQSKPIRRRVALKLIKLGMDTKQVIARFEAERQALALMNHPNVAKVFDAGATEAGRPYFVMEHVPGVPITEHCDRQRLNMVDRLELFRQVCQAVQHAHQKGIIHRDIKPSNILVTIQDGKAVPKVIDFGVAKATEQRLTERTLFTEQGQIIGTPEYMSPEQAEMTAQDIDTRTDIYSLGVLLYELLTGALPFDPQSLRRAGFAEIQRIIREVDPPKPSTKVSSIGAADSATADESVPRPSGSGPGSPRRPDGPLPDGRGTDQPSSSAQQIARQRRTDPSALIKLLRGDLDWITMKALEKDRTRRYASASELAEDILRHLKHEPIVAAPPRAIYRLRKLLRRNRRRVAVLAVMIGVVSTVVAFSFYRKHRDAREMELQRHAQVKQRRAQAREHVLVGIERQQGGEDEAAEREFEQALLYDPNEVSALGNLAILRKAKYFAASPGRAPRSLLEDANVLCERALAVHPDHPSIWNVKCVALYALENLIEAEQACRESIALDRDDYESTFNLAKVLALQRRIEEALEAATQAVETATRLGEANDPWAAGAWQTLATIQLHLGKPEAMQSLERAFECQQQDEWGYILRARLRLTLPVYKDFKAALDDATTANQISKVPDPRIKRTLALACVRNGRYDDAVQYAGEGLELGGLTAAHHLILAIAHAKRANLPAARDHFDAALAAWPDNLDDDGLIVTADREGLWFDTVEELEQLRSEAEQLLSTKSD